MHERFNEQLATLGVPAIRLAGSSEVRLQAAVVEVEQLQKRPFDL
jgi:hypothetical protein